MIDPKLDHGIVEAVRDLSRLLHCRIEISSDIDGYLSTVCCVCSDKHRVVQGMGPTISDAYRHFQQGGVGRA